MFNPHQQRLPFRSFVIQGRAIQCPIVLTVTEKSSAPNQLTALLRRSAQEEPVRRRADRHRAKPDEAIENLRSGYNLTQPVFLFPIVHVDLANPQDLTGLGQIASRLLEGIFQQERLQGFFGRVPIRQ